MRFLIPTFGAMAAGLLALFWLIGWVLLRGDAGLREGLAPIPPLLLAGLAGATAVLHLGQIVAEMLRRAQPALLRGSLWAAGTISAGAGLLLSQADPLTAEFWPLCLISGGLTFLCAAMPAR